MESYNTWWTH